MRLHGLRTITFLHYLVVRNWIRRAMRSPFFWLVVVALAFVVVSIVATALGSGPGDHLRHWLGSGYFEAGVATFMVGAVLVGIWRGVSSAPRASLADVVVLMGSPISSRAHLAYMMIRDCFENGLIVGVWVMAGFGGVLLQTGDIWMPLRMFYLVVVIIVLSEVLRYAFWVFTEQVMVRDHQLGRRIRWFTRLGVIVVTSAFLGYLVPPFLNSIDSGWQDALETLAGGARDIAEFPPMLWASDFILGDSPVLLPGIGIALLPLAVASFALYFAREFVEPIAVNAERSTDARGKITEPGADVQWATMAQFGISPRAKVSIRPFGGGPWAILWASVVRWVRYQIAASWVGLTMLGGFGVLVAIGVRLDYIPIYVGWVFVLATPLLGSVNAFMDELRKQFLFLTPGPAWKRMLAGAATSVLDGLVTSLMIILALLLSGVLPPSHAVGLLVLSAALSIVAQASVALVQVILPYWVPQRVRIAITVGSTVLGSAPALLTMVILYITVSALPALLAGAGIAVVSAAIMLAIGALLFDRVEFTG